MEVRIHPDLRLTVRLLPECLGGIAGRYAFGEVYWDRLACELLPATSLAMIAADVCDALRLFRRGELDAEAWTSVDSALLQLR